MDIFSVLPFEIVFNILQYFHIVDALPLKLVCKTWNYTIDEVFIFYPTSPSPFGLSVKQHFLVENHIGGITQWRMIINFLQHVVPKDCGVITLVIRVECGITEEFDNQQIGEFQSNVAEIAKQTNVMGYIQSHPKSVISESGDHWNESSSSVYDICCQAKPTILSFFLKELSLIQYNDAKIVVFPQDCNFIYRSNIISNFAIKLIEGNGLENASAPTESVHSLNTYTISKSNLAHIKTNNTVEDFVLLLVKNFKCPLIVQQVLSLYEHEEFRPLISNVLTRMKRVALPVFIKAATLDNNEQLGQYLETFWSEFKQQCQEVLQNNQKARHVIRCRSIPLHGTLHN